MALQQKIVVKSDSFVPTRPEGLTDHTIRKERRWDNFKIWIANIKWSKLNEVEFKQQWCECLNSINAAESDKLTTREDLLPYFVGYLKIKKYTKEQIAVLRTASDSLVTFSIVSKAYMLMVGNVDHPSCNITDRWLTKQLKEVLGRAEPAPTALAKPKRDIVAFKRDKCSDIIGELQGLEDQYGEVDVLQFFKDNNVAKEYIQTIEERFRPRLEELQELLSTKDEQLKEAFRCYSRKEIKAMTAWYERLLEDCQAYRQVKVESRKQTVRKARPKPPEKIVARIKYLKHSDTLNISSVDPRKLIGCNQVWLYNTKYRKLIVYHASEQDKEITVKGAYLVGWDPKTSHQKTLRWPDEQLSEFQKTIGRVALRKFMQDIKAKPSALRGGLGPDMLILKVL